MIATVNSCCSPSQNKLHVAFLALRPKIETHARIYFRGVTCPAQREDKVAETTAPAWKWFVRLAERGKDATSFPMAFTIRVAKAVKCGRLMCGQEKAKDVLSSVAQRRHGFQVKVLSAVGSASHEAAQSSSNRQHRLEFCEERLQDNTITPVPDQAAFRIDFPSWLESLTPRERQLIRAMATDERTKDLSKHFQLSPGRISQLRREFESSWRQYVGDEVEGNCRAPKKANPPANQACRSIGNCSHD